VSEATASAALGISNVARLTTYHSTAFYAAYLRAGEQMGLARSVLGSGLVRKPANPWPAALSIQKTTRGPTNTPIVRRRQARLRAASQLEGSIEDIVFDGDPTTNARIKELFEYQVVLVDTTGERPILRLHDRYAELTDDEQAAILCALNLTPFVRHVIDPEATRGALKVHDLRQHVFSVLLPYLDPEISKSDKALHDIRAEPNVLLTGLHKGLWTGEIQTKNWKGDLDIEQFSPDAPDNFKTSLRRLYIAAHRFLAKRGLELDEATFSALHEQYRQNVQTLLELGARPSVAPHIGLYYAPDPYSQIKAYAVRNPDISSSFVDVAFYSVPTRPLQKIRTFEKTLELLRTDSARSLSFTDCDLKLLAKRGLTPEEVWALARVDRRLKRKYDQRVPASKVHRICVSYRGDPEDLEELVRAACTDDTSGGNKQ